MASVLVTGATGTVGSRLVGQLASRDVRVRAFVRDRRKAAALLGPNVEAVEGDLDRPETVEAALADVESLFLLPPANPKQGERDAMVVDLARRMGVSHVVKLSALNAAADSPVDDLRWHRAGEVALLESGLGYTILRCNFFTQFFLIFAPSIRAESVFRAPVTTGRVSPIDAGDIAAAAAAVLVDGERHNGRTYELTGPESLSYPEVAEKLSAALGRPIGYATVSPAESERELLAAGHPDWETRILIQLFEEIEAGRFARVSSSVEGLTGREATSFDQFARDYRGEFIERAR
jgi:uncharacterized protein YbjT (DUF2867 family)